MAEYLKYQYRLVYRMKNLSNMWIKGEANDSTVSLECISGNAVRDGFSKAGLLTGDEENFRFTFAYLCVNGKRGIPSPSSFSFFKGDHTQIRDSLADGHRADEYDREHNLWTCYLDDINADTMLSTSVRRRTVTVNNQSVYVIASNQLFSGSIEGSREDIEAMAELCEKNTELHLGAAQESGLGLCEIEVVYVEKIESAPEQMLEEFTVHINSPMPVFTPSGLYDERPESILALLENLLGCEGELELVGVCRKTSNFYRKNQPLALCTEKGGALRVRSKNGSLDISPLVNGWLGEFTKDGYGEITAGHVAKNYYRKMLVLGEDI